MRQQIVFSIVAIGFFSGICFAITPEQIAAIQAISWAKDTPWESKLSEEVHQLFVCRASEPNNDLSPCNYLAGHVLNDVYGINDFNTATGFLTADDMITKVLASKDIWSLIGSANLQDVLSSSQDKANARYAVIALYPSIGGKPGHVALIIPGQLSASESWGLNVPNSASFFLNDPVNSYFGKRLSAAFAPEKRGDIRIFYRIGSNIRP